MKLDVESVAERIVPPLLRNYRVVLALAAVVTVLGAVFSAKLYADLRSDVEELLPAYAPSVVAARTIGPKVHNVTHLSIVLEGNDPDALERFSDDLAKKLRALPKEMVSTVDYKTDEQQAFIKRFGALYVDLPDLQQISGALDKRIAWEKKHAIESSMDLLDEPIDATPPPKLDLDSIEKKYAQATGQLSQFRNGYYQTPDGHILAMLVRPPEISTGYSANKALLDAVREAV